MIFTGIPEGPPVNIQLSYQKPERQGAEGRHTDIELKPTKTFLVEPKYKSAKKRKTLTEDSSYNLT